MPYYVYILECVNKALYTGITNNLARRLRQHKTGEGGHYTSYNPGKRIRYSEEHPNRSAATKREIQIKRWSRTKKLALIKGERGFLKAASRCRKKK
ncbi:MAG: GIY-YIG nuclease family protein [Candidatus Margulisiibacteriota bacterium]|nr:GIY-YIG nuclease family protein [Candidatus Margulisiibacteriota bacterium]